MDEDGVTKYSASPRRVLAYIWTSTKRHHWFFAITFVVVCLAQVCFVMVPLQLKILVDTITGQSPSVAAAAVIAGTIFWMVILRMVGGFLYRSSGYIYARRGPRIRAELEETALQGILAHSYAFFSDQHTGSLVRRIGRLSDSYERAHSTFYWNILASVVSVVAIIVELALTRPAAAWIVAVFIVVIFIGNYFMTKWKIPADEARTRAQNAAQGLLADIVTNATTVKLFAQEMSESRAFHRDLDERIRTERVAWSRAEHGLTATDVAGALLTGGLLYLALWGWEDGKVTVGDFVLLQSFSVMLMDQLFFVGFAFRDLIEALTNSSEIVGILRTKTEVRDAKNAKRLNVTRGWISFSHVDFSYGKTNVLSDLDLEVASGEKIAFVGASGAGKSTIVKLLLRFYDLKKGKILIDGQDISKVTQESLREQVSLVPQEPLLFHRSLKDNISYGRLDPSMEQIISAAKKAHCHEFISTLPDGYETMVGERGVKLSGGERQRVAIARAILADAPILVLDEATSSLDSESELLIQQALIELMREKTVIVIAHRLSTIMGMDRIIVMEQGRVKDMGTHDELLQKIGTYQKLWSIQAGGFQST